MVWDESQECIVLLALPGLLDSRAGLYAWTSRPAPEKPPELRESHAQDPRHQLGQTGELGVTGQILPSHSLCCV